MGAGNEGVAPLDYGHQCHIIGSIPTIPAILLVMKEHPGNTSNIVHVEAIPAILLVREHPGVH